MQADDTDRKQTIRSHPRDPRLNICDVDCRSSRLPLLPVPHHQLHWLPFEDQLRLQLETLVELPVFKRTIAIGILDLLELLWPVLGDGNRGKEEREAGLVAMLLLEHLVHRGEEHADH